MNRLNGLEDFFQKKFLVVQLKESYQFEFNPPIMVGNFTQIWLPLTNSGIGNSLITSCECTKFGKNEKISELKEKTNIMWTIFKQKQFVEI